MAVALVSALLLGLIVWPSMVRVSGEGRTFRRPALGGRVIRLAPGWHFIVPLLDRVIRVPDGQLEVAAAVPVRSREGASLMVPFHAAAQIGNEPLAVILGAAGPASDPREAIRRDATIAITDWSAGSSNEQIVLLQGERGLEETIRRALERRGFDGVSVRLGQVQGPADMLASVRAGALRDRVVDTGTRVAMFGLDAADWEIIDPMIERGQLPNLARLKARGAWGNMKSMNPMLSPLLWTSIATGKPPEEHGIVDFLVKDTRTGQAVPVSSRWRKVKALWNLFTDAGRTSAFVGWWGTWPAEAVDGYMVSDRVAYSLFGFKAAEGDRVGATHPPEYFRQIRSKIVEDSSIPFSQVQEFVRVAPAEFRALRAQIASDARVGYREPVNHLTKILAGAMTYQAIGLDILARGQPGLFSIYYEGIDEVCHRFAHFMPPKMAMVSDEEFAKYHGAVEAYYRFQDRLLGEMLAKLNPDTTVIVLSDHGFQNGSGRPTEDPPYIEGKPGLWHRRYGIVILAGPTIQPGHLDTTSLLDIAPTVLYLSGLPVAEDMHGRVMVEAIDPGFRSRFSGKSIPSYEGIGRPLQNSGEVVGDSTVDQEMMEQLRSLGYIGGESTQAGGGAQPAGQEGSQASRAPDSQALVTGHINEASLFLKNKDYARAEAAVAEAMKIAPDLAPVLILAAQVQSEQKRYGPAIQALQKVLNADPEGEKELYSQIGRMFSESGRSIEGIAYLKRLAGEHPRIGEIRAAVGAIHLKGGETAAAERELLEALRINPALGEPLTQLHTIYRGTDRILSLEPIVRRGLEINEKSVVHHNWMGLIYEWKKQVPQAEREFQRAMELDPDYAATMANLGALYGRTQRLPQAIEVLSRAISKDPDNLEAWVNLGAAQGRIGHPREAIEALETARRKGLRTTTLFNALALAYLQDRQKAKALQYLKESLAIDPGQKDAQDLLRAVTRSS